MPSDHPTTSVGLSTTLTTTATNPVYTIAQRRQTPLVPPLIPIPTDVPRTKLLTCSYWNTGYCKWSEEECLYSHRPTGKVASPPQQVEQGR